MRVFSSTENVFNAVDAIIKYGFAAIDGTKTIAENHASRIIECLKPYTDIEPSLSYQHDVPNHGYLYYVYDINRFYNIDDRRELKEEIIKVGRNNPL